MLPYFSMASSTSHDEANDITLLWGEISKTIYKTFTFQDFSFCHYRLLLSVILTINILFLVLQITRVIYVSVERSWAKENALPIVLLAICLTIANIVNVLKLITSPTPTVAVSSMVIMVIQEFIFIAETIIYYNLMNSRAGVFLLSVLFLVLQVWAILVIYRFWEMVLFNYDGNSWETSSSSTSGGRDLADTISIEDTVATTISPLAQLHPSLNSGHYS